MSAAPCSRRRTACGACRKEMLETVPGYGPDVEKNRAGGAQNHGEGRLRAGQAAAGQGLDPQHRDLSRSGGHPDRPAQEIYIDAELESSRPRKWFPKIARKEYAIGLNLTGNGVDDPDQTSTRIIPAGRSATTPTTAIRRSRSCSTQQSVETDIDKRKKLVWEIDKKLQEDVARPIIYHGRAGTCWQPYVKGVTMQ